MQCGYFGSIGHAHRPAPETADPHPLASWPRPILVQGGGGAYKSPRVRLFRCTFFLPKGYLSPSNLFFPFRRTSSQRALSSKTKLEENHNATPSTLSVPYFLLVVEGQKAHPRALGVTKQV